MATRRRQPKKKTSELLSEWLEENELTIMEFAKIVDCSKQTVSAIRNGKFPPGLPLAARIEKATKIPAVSWVE